MSRKSEREAAQRAHEILRRAETYQGDADYGAGKLTKAQKKSQEREIGWTKKPSTWRGKIARNLWG